MRSRFLVALLAVILVAETVLAVTFYNQHRQHSINEDLVSLGQRMHHMADFQFGVAQLALQPMPVGAGQTNELHSMLASSEANWLRGVSAANRAAVRLLGPRFAALASVRARFDSLPADSPRRRLERTVLIDDARKLMATTNRLHHSVDTRILAAQANAESQEDDAFRTFLFGSAISLLAAVALALLLAQTISRPMARLAAGARELGAGRLDTASTRGRVTRSAWSRPSSTRWPPSSRTRTRRWRSECAGARASSPRRTATSICTGPDRSGWRRSAACCSTG